jgi:hypothetical protein
MSMSQCPSHRRGRVPPDACCPPNQRLMSIQPCMPEETNLPPVCYLQPAQGAPSGTRHRFPVNLLELKRREILRQPAELPLALKLEGGERPARHLRVVRLDLQGGEGRGTGKERRGV